MCKLAILTNTAKLNQNQVKLLIDSVAKNVFHEEPDGFGFAYATDEGTYSERWVDPLEYRERKLPLGPANKLMQACEVIRDGKPGNPSGGLLIHGRTSTNEITLESTHPFLNTRYALIHNGIVTNVGNKVKRKTTCDTEFILKRYHSGGIKSVASTLSGYYAVGMLDKKTGNTIIFRDSTANLYVTYLSRYQTYCFATRPSMIVSIADSLAINESMYTIKPAITNFHAVFNRAGDLLNTEQFTPMIQSFGDLDNKSIGYHPIAGEVPKDDPYDWPPETGAMVSEFYSKSKHDVVYVTPEGDHLNAYEYSLLPRWDQDECWPLTTMKGGAA